MVHTKEIFVESKSTPLSCNIWDISFWNLTFSLNIFIIYLGGFYNSKQYSTHFLLYSPKFLLSVIPSTALWSKRTHFSYLQIVEMIPKDTTLSSNISCSNKVRFNQIPVNSWPVPCIKILRTWTQMCSSLKNHIPAVATNS